jgi:S-ribosylhomocysteine lyase
MEHLFAVRVRNGALGAHVIYFGPMGCRTGFYLLLKDLSDEGVVELIRDAVSFIACYDGPIPGATEKECGNWREHDLAGAKKAAAEYAKVIAGWTAEQLKY